MSLVKSVLGVAIVALLTGCGSGSIVQSLKVDSEVDANNDTLVSLETNLNLGSLQFPALSLPVLNPKNSSEQIGSVSLSRSTSGFNTVTLEANASKILAGDIQASGKLPNGNSIPLTTTGGVATINLSSSSRLYLGGGSQPFIGFAIVISQFDALGSYVSGYSLFLNLAQSLGLNGVAGVFSGGKGQNGIGLFVSIPNVASPTGGSPSQTLASSSAKMTSRQAQLSRSTNEDVLSFIATDENSSKSKRLKSALVDMSQRKTKLQVK